MINNSDLEKLSISQLQDLLSNVDKILKNKLYKLPKDKKHIHKLNIGETVRYIGKSKAVEK